MSKQLGNPQDLYLDEASMELIGSIMFSVLAMLFTLGILVTIHEYGHYRVARLCGVQVERFSIGLGKIIYRWHGKPDPRNPDAPPTEFAISIVPVGGYVKMLGEQEQDLVDPKQHEAAFNHKPLSSRAAIIAAGPAANFALALVLYWLMFVTGVSGLAPVVGRVAPGSVAFVSGLQADDIILAVDGEKTPTWQEVRMRMLDKLGESGSLKLLVGKHEDNLTREVDIPVKNWLGSSETPDQLADLGIVPFHQNLPAKIDSVLPDGRARAAGLLAGDLITEANGKPVLDWNDWLKQIHDNPEKSLVVGLVRGELPLQLTMRPAVRMTDNGTPELDSNGQTQGFIGASVVMPKMPSWMNRNVHYNPLEAIPQAVKETWTNSVFVLVSMKKMLGGLISLKNISGPITIAQVAGQTARIGFEYYISFLAVLSVSLGIFNLLPIPVLDGGHLLYIGMEALFRKPVPRRYQEWGLQAGLLLVAGFMFLALYNDVSRLF